MPGLFLVRPAWAHSWRLITGYGLEQLRAHNHDPDRADIVSTSEPAHSWLPILSGIGATAIAAHHPIHIIVQGGQLISDRAPLLPGKYTISLGTGLVSFDLAFPAQQSSLALRYAAGTNTFLDLIADSHFALVYAGRRYFLIAVRIVRPTVKPVRHAVAIAVTVVTIWNSVTI